MKVLLSCFACAPNKGSEPGVGWNWAMALSKHNDVWVLTREENRREIEAYHRDHDLPFHVEYFGIGFFERIRGLPYRKNFYTMHWQKKVVEFAKKLHDKQQFDIVHHLTYASFKYPTELYKLGIPLIVGPVGGGEKTPASCRVIFSTKYRLIESLHDYQIRHSIATAKFVDMCRNAKRIMVTTPETLAYIPVQYSEKTEVMQTIGISKDEIIEEKSIKAIAESEPFRIIYVGNLLQLKGVRMIPDIAEQLKGLFDFTFEIVGDGPERGYLESKIKEKGLKSNFTFHDVVERSRVFQLLDKSHLFIFPSFHDSGAMAVLEGMAARVPCLVLGTGGPAMHITDGQNGYKVDSSQEYKEIVQMFADRISTIRNMYLMDLAQIEKITCNAVSYLNSSCVWNQKAELMTSIYNAIFL